MRIRGIVLLASVAVALLLTAPRGHAQGGAAGDPVIVLDTAKGTIEIQLFRADAPKSVEHILELMKRSFYRGQRFHRVTASIAQFGDPQSRDMTRKAYWGSGGSGSPIGVFELNKKRTHVRGAVGLAHSGNPLGADSQLYIMKAASPGLDGKHTIVGRVSAGLAVVDKIAADDLIKNATVK